MENITTFMGWLETCFQWLNTNISSLLKFR